jgi:DNA-binding transcriptional LysR family regulator
VQVDWLEPAARFRYLKSGLDTRLLRVFCSVAQQGSLAAAARQLHLTASALSHSLKALESHLGCRLFDRVGKQIVLNQAGEQLLAQVQAPLSALAAAEDALKNLARWGKSRLRIGAATSSCHHILPAVLRELLQRCRQVSVEVESGDMHKMLERLAENRIDLALGIGPVSDPRFDLRPMFRDELMYVFALNP